MVPLQLPTPIAIVGLGRSGVAAHALLLDLGYQKDQIYGFDRLPIAPFSDLKVFSDPQTMISEVRPRTLIISPGVHLKQDWIQSAKEQGVRIESELSLAFAQLSHERCVCVTGSIGKSTVTSLIGVAAKSQDPFAFVGGNLGTPLAEYVLQARLGQRKSARWIVLELSSYQLENFENLACDVGVFTFLTPNHLERYESLAEYYDQKWTLVQKTRTALVMNRNGGDLSQDFKRKLRQNAIPANLSLRWTEASHWPKSLSPRLLGEYNKDNLAVALAVAQLLGWTEKSAQALADFPGLPHRLENLGERSGRLFINDSKATTMESVLSAVETLSTQSRPLVLLLGGHDKNLPWESLKPLGHKKNIRFIFFGNYAEQARLKTKLTGPSFSTLKEALGQLPTLSRTGDCVLLSPGGTSHDEFKHFEERGLFFRREIERLFP